MAKRLFALFCVIALSVSALAVTGMAATQDDTLKAGYATVDVNPYWSTYSGARKPSTLTATDMMPLPMAGYGDNAHRLSAPALIDANGDGKVSGPDGDGLHATVLAIQSGDQTVVIITVDIINFKSAHTKQVRNLITEATGIPGTNVMINGTHTHGGVDMGATFSADGEPYKSADGKTSYTAAECTAYLEHYTEYLINKLVDAAKVAVADLSPATMEKGTIDAGVENGGKTMNGVRHYVQKYTESNGTSVTYVRGSSFNNNVNGDNKYDSYYTNCYTGGDYLPYRDTHVSDSDDAMHLLRFKVDGKKDILLVNWRGHPASSNKSYKNSRGKSVNIYQNLYSDYIGALRYNLDSSGYRSTFILGASGNLGASSALDWEDWVNPQAESKGVPFAVEYGRIVANTTKALLNKTKATSSGDPMKSVASGPIVTSQLKYRAKIQVPSALELAACKAYQANAESIAAHDSYVYTDPTTKDKFVVASSYHANAVVNRSVYTEGATRSIELNVITVGKELSFIAMPYEASDRYSMEATLTTANNYNDWDMLAKIGSFGTPFVMTCSNDHIGYIPNHLAYNYNKDSVHYGKYAAGSYESQTSPFADGEGEKILQTYKDMLEQMQTKTGYCQGCKQDVLWMPLNQALISSNDHKIPAGHYYLVKDLVYVDSQVGISGDSKVCLDLNGHTYSVAHPKNASRAANMSGTAVLNIQDSSKEQTGTMMGRGVLIETAADGFTCGTLLIGSGCTVNLYSGTLTQEALEGYHATNSGVVKVTGTLNMYGGTVTGGVASKSDGGNIYVDGNGVFNMYGGTISNGTAAEKGGNLYIHATGKFNMYGGKITGGTAKNGPSVYVYYNSSNKHSVRLTGTTDGDAPVQITCSSNSANMLRFTGKYTGKVEIKTTGSMTDGRIIAACDAGTDIGGATITVVNMGELTPVVEDGYVKLRKRSGWMQIGGQWYYFYEPNKAQTGWYQEDGDWHYFDETGVMQIGWFEAEGKRYYADENGHRVSGTLFVADTYSIFDENGVWEKTYTGWFNLGDKKYYANAEGILAKSWTEIGGKRYYFNAEYVLQTGWIQLGNNKYYLGEDGAMRIGWQEMDGKKYYFDPDGVMHTRWLDLNGVWYYFKLTGEMTTGWFAYGPYWYYLNAEGEMLTGWILYGGKNYFFDRTSGRMVTEKWVGDGGKWYYCDANGHMVTGWLELGSAKYYMKPDGSMVTGTYTIDGKQHNFDGNGIWKGETTGKTGWVQEGSKWYYYNKGKMVTGWFLYGPYWYYMDGNGVMKTGWLLYGGKWYYFDLSSGRMATDSRTIGGKVYNFDANGVCLNP